jgi:type II secretory pathway component PulF
MPFFQYQATDASGQRRDGTLRADSMDAALAALRQGGLQVHTLDGRPVGGPAPQPPRPQVRPTATPPRPVAPQPAPAARPAKNAAAASGPLIITRPDPALANAPAPVVGQPAVAPIRYRTIIGTDKDRFFLFSQFAAATRAGINPAQAFDQISNRTKPYYRDSVRALSAAAVEGADLATIMERYPDLYPEHVVGMTRAGQQAGYLPEAFEEVARQAENAHKFKRWFFWIWFVAINAIVSIPGMWWATQAMVRGYERIEAKGGQGGPGMGFQEMAGAYWEKLAWPFGPAFLLFCFVLYILKRYFGSRVARRFRHRIGLKFPVYGPRTKHENLARFSWSLSRLSKAGFAPANAYMMAAETVPNLEMRDQLREIAGRITEATKMSDILHGSRLFPDEYAPVVATAEYTGDLPGAFDQLSRSSQSEFETAQNYAKARSGCWGALGCFVTSGIMLAILWYVWYHQLPAVILKGMDI